MAVHAALDDQGFDLWNRWSQGADNYDAQAARTVWKGFKADGGITIATLFDEAKRQGWRDAGDHPKPSAQEIAERERLAVERARRGQAKIASIREKTAENAARIWKAAHPAPVDNPYLVRKGIAPVANLRETTAEAVAKELGYVPESVSWVHPNDDADLCETSDRFHGVSAVTGHWTIIVSETPVTPKVSMGFQPETALPRACTRETRATPEPMNPEFKRPYRALARARRWRFGGHKNRCSFTRNFGKKGNAS